MLHYYNEEFAIMFQVVFVLIDGIADINITTIKSRTPLQKARIPIINSIARSGLNGLMDPIEPGITCGSDTAHMSILGYEPRKFYSGRGAFESLGTGLNMSEKDIAFKCNIAHMNENNKVVEMRRIDRNFEKEGSQICNDLNSK